MSVLIAPVSTREVFGVYDSRTAGAIPEIGPDADTAVDNGNPTPLPFQPDCQTAGALAAAVV
jgi:hypothetical protein